MIPASDHPMVTPALAAKIRHYSFAGSEADYPVGKFVCYVDPAKTFSVNARVIAWRGGIVYVVPIDEPRPL